MPDAHDVLPASRRTDSKRLKPAAPRRFGWLLLALVAVAAITFAAYTGAFDNAFVTWDDPTYVVENPLVQRQRYGALLTAVVSSNYHPLTMLSLALNVRQPLSPRPFILTNVVLHTLNTLLVFWLVFLVSDRRLPVAFLVALLFGIHPMHVESVAWTSERKDVLYAFFFLAGSITYWHYLERRARRWLLVTFALFVLSCLSKGMAVVFPLVMALLDYVKGRPVFGPRSTLEKIPFLGVALLFGLVAVNVQSGGDFHGLLTRLRATEPLGAFTPSNLLERVIFPTYGHMMYLWRLLVPVHLCAFYPYPPLAEASQPKYFLAPLLFLATLALAIWDLRRTRIISFGVGWYLVTVALVLQWVPVGLAIMADRYTYLPYIGLFYVLGMGIAKIFERNRPIGAALWCGSGLFAAFLFPQTLRQVETWKDNEALWSTVIEVAPHDDMAYINRANYRGRSGRVREAMADLQAALRLGSQREEVFHNLGNAYGALGKSDSALVMFNRALSIQPNNGSAHYNRAIIYLRLDRPGAALADLARTLELMPERASTLHAPRGHAYLQLGRPREAIAELDRAIAAGGIHASTFYDRGLSRLRIGDRAGAATDFREALRLDASHAEAKAQLKALEGQ